MELCPKCDGAIVLWKDAYDRFEHFYECQMCKSRFWMKSNQELSQIENQLISGFLKKIQ